MSKLKFLTFIILSAFIVTSRLTFRFPFLYSWDSIQFALSISEYNIVKHQPHPPGYIFYSLGLRALNHFVQDPNLGMIILNIFFTLLGSLFLYLTAEHILDILGMYGANTKFAFSVGAAVLYATNPINWFYGSVAEIYAVEGGLVSVMTYLVIASKKNPKLILIASLALGVVGGIRLSTEFFFLPAYFYTLLNAERKKIRQSILIIVLSNLIWLIPVAVLSGGIDKYINILISQFRGESAHTAGYDTENTLNILAATIQAATFPLLCLLIVKFRKTHLTLYQGILIFAVAPALLFFLFVHYAKPGYFLYVLPLLIVISILILTYTVNYKIAFLFLIFSILINLLAFLKPPIFTENEYKQYFVKRMLYKITFPNRHSRKAEENRLKLFFKKIAEFGDRKKCFVVQSGYWPDWRTIMYYYPNDTAILLLPKKHAAVAQKHYVYNARQPIFLDGDERIIFTIGDKPTNSQMRSFQIERFTVYYGHLRHFPNGFRVYEFQFFKRRIPRNKDELHQ